MKLEEFVKEALEAILHGVRDAQSGYTGSAAAPPESDRMNPLGREDIVKFDVAVVKFDVAVAIEAGSSVEGSGKGKFLSIVEVGGGATSNRVQFEVSVFRMRP